MAFTNFYLIAGGTGSADINAGSSIGAAVGGPTTGGAWTNATNTFVAASGTPFASANVGDYVSIYADGATVTTYVAQITNVVSNVSVILSATIKYGTAPTDGAANRSAVLGGSWNTEQVLAAGGLGTTTVPQSTKINIKGNLTVTANRTVSMAGATTTPLWFSGYNTTPGDLDNDTTNSLAKPIWTFNSTFGLTTNSVYQYWSGLSLTGSRTGALLTVANTSQVYSRLRVVNTSSNAGALAVTMNSETWWIACYFNTPSTATTTGVVAVTAGVMNAFGCTFDGGGLSAVTISTRGARLFNCVGLNNVTNFLLATTGALGVQVIGCTVYNATNGVQWTSTPSLAGGMPIVAGTLFSGVSGGTAMTNGINNSSGTNTSNIFRFCNDYYNVTNPEVGFGDSPAFFPQTDSAFPLTSSTDLTPLSTSNAAGHGFPAIFENETFKSYLDIGAVQRQVPVSSAGFFIQ